MRNCRSRLIIAPAILLALGCGSPTTTVPFEEPSIQAKEGTRFRYWVDYLIDGEKLEFYGESRLISTIAEIGGRDSLLAYEWAPDNRLEFWDASNGELWQYYSTTETTGDPQSGVWLQFPTAGMGKITTTVVDVTITDSHGSTYRFKRLIESEPVKRESVRYQGRRLELQSVISKEMEMSWSDGVPNDTNSVTHNYTFIIGLGMLESSTSAIGHDRKKTILVSIDEE